MFPDLFQNDPAGHSDMDETMPDGQEGSYRTPAEYWLAKSIVSQYLKNRCVYWVRKIVSRIRSLSSGGLSGEDSGLANVWEEFVDQVQYEESIFFDQYVGIIEGVCAAITETIPEHELWLIWLDTIEWLDHEGSDRPAINEVQNAVAGYFYGLVSARAADEPLPKAREKYYDQLALDHFHDDQMH